MKSRCTGPLVKETKAFTKPNGMLTSPTFQIPIEHVTKDLKIEIKIFSAKNDDDHT